MVVAVLSRIFKGRGVAGRKVNRGEALLALLAAFREQGKKQVSLGEFQVAIKGWQENFPLEYSFSKAFLYSYQLFEDLRILEYGGEVVEFQYRHDAFLPKSFIELNPSGLKHGQEILSGLSEQDRVALQNAVSNAVEHYYHSWRLWSRATVDAR